MTATAGKQSAYYLFAECKIARWHAEHVKECELQGTAGAWGEWLRFVEQWPLDSQERSHLNEVFGYELDILDAAEHDPLIRDIW